MGYALAAIPIWFSKILLTIGGLAAVTNIGQRALGTIVRFFEKLMFFDFSGLFSGNSNNSDHILSYNGSNDNFQFFPSSSSPFFILWIVFFSAGVLLIILSIVYTLISHMNTEEDKESFYISKLFTNVIAVLVTIFFIPFMLFSSMTITSTAVKALFKSNSSTASKQSINEYKSNFLNRNIEVINNIYNLGKNNPLTMKDNSPNALYSHTDDTKTDKFVDNISNKSPIVTIPFTSYNDILSRFNYELTFLEKNNTSYFDSTTQLLISQTKQDLEKYQKDWISNKKITNNLESIKQNISRLSYNKKNQSLSTQMDNLANNIKKYHLATLKLFNQLREIISKQEIFIISLDDTLDVPKKKPFNKRLTVLMTTNNKTININILKQAIEDKSGKNKLDNKKIEQLHKLASFINIYSLTKVYLAPKIYKTIQDWKQPLTFKKSQAWNSNKTLMDSAANINKMIIGYKYGKDIISYKYLAAAFSDFKKTSLSEVVDEIGSVGLGDPITMMVMVFVQWSVLIMVFSIMFILYKRLLERLLKLIWLWISGPIVMSTAVKSGSQSIRNWFTMVMTEMIVLISLGLGWAIWKQLTPILFNWITGGTSSNRSTAHIIGDAFTLGLVSTISTALNPGHIILKIFIALGLLGLVIKTSDWLLEALGGSTRLRDISSNVRGDLNRSKQNINRQKKEAISKVQFDQKQKDKGLLPQGSSSKGANKSFDRGSTKTKK